MGNIYSYMRISTSEERGLQKFTRQEKSLITYAKSKGIEYLLTFKDDCGGKDFNRPQWQRLEKILQNGDTIVFKEISRFTRDSKEGYEKYMKLINKGINLVFLDNPTVSTDYIKNLMEIADTQNIVTKTALEGTIKLLLIVELDRVEQEREIIVKRIKQGIQASDKKSGRKQGQLDKITEELKTDIKLFLKDRSIKQIDLINKHNISRNTLKKYIKIIEEEQ